MALIFGLRSWYSYSEGYLSPRDAVAAAKKAMAANPDGSPDCIAFADKGETAGYFEFIDACREEGINYVPGIEVNLSYDGEIRQVLLFGLLEEGETKLRNVLAASKLINENEAPADVDAALPVIQVEDLSPSLMVLSGQDGSHLMSYRRRHEMLSAKEFIQSITKTGARFAMALDPDTIEPREQRFFKEIEGMGVKSIPYRPNVIAGISQITDMQDVISAAFPKKSIPESWTYEIPEIQTPAQLVGRKTLPGYDPVAISLFAARAGIKPTENVAVHGDLPYNGQTLNEALATLRQRCLEGFDKRVSAVRNTPIDPAKAKPYLDRLDRELEVIGGLRFQSRLLVMADFVDFCASNNKEAFARGSAANSVAVWMLGISKIDPVFHDLPMERFLNPDRPSMPDIDIDFPPSFAKEAFEFMVQRLPNATRIRQVRNTTIGDLLPRLAARFNIRNPDKLSEGLKSALELTEFPKGYSLRDLEEEYPKLKEKFIKLREDSPENMESLYRTLSLVGSRPLGFSPHVGIAACDATVASKVPVLPIRTPDGGWTLATGIAHSELESHGILKFDLLPRQTLDWVARINARAAGTPIPSMNDVALKQDKRVFTEVVHKGLVAGIDQIHKHGETLKVVKPNNFADLCALSGLIRPGAVGIIPEDSKKSPLPPGVARYVKGESPLRDIVSDLGPKAIEILELNTKKTRGMVIYDEQFSRLLHDLSDVPVGKCEVLRRARAKSYEMDPEIAREVITGISKKFGATSSVASQTFEHLSNEGGYLFPKGHAATYTLAALHLASLKREAPAAYVAGYIDHFWLDSAKIRREEFKSEVSFMMRDARELGVSVARMDFSKSILTSIESDGQKLRIGLDTLADISRDEIQRVRDNISTFESEVKDGKPPTPERLAQAPFFLSNETITSAALVGAFLYTGKRPTEIAKEFSTKDIPYQSPAEAARGIMGFVPGFAHPGLGADADNPERGKSAASPIPIDAVALHEEGKDPFFVTGFIADRSIYKGRNRNGFSVDFSITALRGDTPVRVKMWFTPPLKDRTAMNDKVLKKLEEDSEMLFRVLNGHYEKRPMSPITMKVKLDAYRGHAQIISVGNRVEIGTPEVSHDNVMDKGSAAKSTPPPIDPRGPRR